MRLFTALVVTGLLAGTAARADDEAQQGSIGVQVKFEEDRVVVVEALKGGPADKAGIKAGDVIVKVGDVKADDLEKTVQEIVRHKPGEKIKVTVKRGDKEMVITVTAGKRSEVLPKKDD